MTAPWLAFLLLLLASFGILTVLLVGLVRNGLRLARSFGAFFDEASPVVDQIAAEADKAARHAARLVVAAASIRSRD